MTPLPLTIFADFACPYSYVTEAILWGLVGADVELIPRSFELYPEPVTLPIPHFPAEEWRTLEELAVGAEVAVRHPTFRPRTRKAHEAARFAREKGREIEIRKQIFSAYWTDGSDIGRIDVLSELAGRVGLDAEELRIALDIDSFEKGVRRDQEVGRSLRVPGTPTLFIGSGTAAQVVVGAHSAPELRGFVAEGLSNHNRAGQAENG